MKSCTANGTIYVRSVACEGPGKECNTTSSTTMTTTVNDANEVCTVLVYHSIFNAKVFQFFPFSMTPSENVSTVHCAVGPFPTLLNTSFFFFFL